MVMPASKYIWQQVRVHTHLFFRPEALQLLDGGTVELLPFRLAVQAASPSVVIPTDIRSDAASQRPYIVPFNGTHLTVWGRLPHPGTDGWTALPNEDTPLWYVNRHGTIMPAWNAFGNLFDLLTFQEERQSSSRDKHGRFVAEFSSRRKAGLLEVPAFNEAVAALVAACAGLRQGGLPLFQLDGLLKPATMILSHDCDLLRGNDPWTQAVRCYRAVQPLLHGRLPRPSCLWWMARNLSAPERFYFDNVTGMIDLESQFGFTSTFYLLNGKEGRFGARSGSASIPRVANHVPAGWNLGMHYNYNTYLNHTSFQDQRGALAAIAPTACQSGRAHYLRFDPERSFPFLESFGLRCDESAGYPDKIGYRCGIAGCFQAFDAAKSLPLRIWEVPLAIMDETIVRQYAESAIQAFSRLLFHLSRIGGGLSLLIHPGLFFNPEFPEMLGLYHELLIEARQLNARSITATRLAEIAASVQPA